MPILAYIPSYFSETLASHSVDDSDESDQGTRCKGCEGDKCVNQLTTEREQLIVDLEEATNNAECLANQNQELELEVNYVILNVINHILTPLFCSHFPSFLQTPLVEHCICSFSVSCFLAFDICYLANRQSCADEVSLLEEIGQDGIFGGPIHLQTDRDSADEQTDIPEYMTPQMLPPAKPTGFIDAPKLEYLEQEVGRVCTLEETIASLMEQLDVTNSECDDLHSELFTSRAQVKLKEKECSCYSNSLEEKREENLSLERQLISLIEQKVVLSEETAAYEIDVSCLLKSNINKKLQTEEHTSLEN
ncbi:hypothetical protein LOD99_9937 [Oopsacas minuta]|uniref:Uncharacterized protein n=1 Tax=Oopsacas minuta TaxID=111878 RepID=A0AAV7KL48_9METZ|nr:hypothetical protein LOD99_9937 [Oopsacas minuta]